MINNQLPIEIYQWLKERGISDQILSTYEIGFNGQIIIPVHDSNGKVLFNKYRRNPFTDEGIKYRYDVGAKSCLYGLKTLDKTKSVIICEGELDALCLMSNGYQAISGTGGAGTFKIEWTNFIPQDVYICLDSDDAGVKGSININSIVKNSKIVVLPEKTKDVTEYFCSGKTVEDFNKLLNDAETYEYPRCIDSTLNKKELNKLKKEFEFKINILMEKSRTLRSTWKSDKYVKVVLQIWRDAYEEILKQLRFVNRPATYNNLNIEEAKQIPIDRFIKFNYSNFSKCIWHNDSNPSMYWYKKQGRVKCFSCGKHGDVIDVVQQKYGVNLQEAIKIITNSR